MQEGEQVSEFLSGQVLVEALWHEGDGSRLDGLDLRTLNALLDIVGDAKGEEVGGLPGDDTHVRFACIG